MVTAFQKGNRRALSEAAKATVYVPSGINTNTNATNPATIQQVVPWQFKGNGQIEVSLPFGFTIPNGVQIGQASLIANSSGSYAAGYHPIVQYSAVTSLSANQVMNTDVFIVQY